METLMENAPALTSDTSQTKPESLDLSYAQGLEFDPCNEALATKSSIMQDNLSDLESQDLTDDDLYDLLLEIEEELRLDDEVLLEEVLEEERTSLEYQVNEYEDWEFCLHQEGRVVCPLCTASCLCLSQTGDIYCDDEYCPMRIRPFDQRNPLLAFKNYLGELFEEHSKRCQDQLVFTACTNQKGVSVFAFCTSCNLHRQL